MNNNTTTISVIKSLLFVLILGTVSLFNTLQAQTVFGVKDKPSIVISGTSTLHDWDMTCSNANVIANLTMGTNNEINTFNSVVFSMLVNDLKSKHTAMDNNAYKALKKDKNPAIAFVMTPGTGTVTSLGNGNYTLKCKGKLTVAGTTLETDLTANCKVNADKTITVSGTKDIDMTTYKVDPPSFMMGAVKTGKNIKLKFSVTLK